MVLLHRIHHIWDAGVQQILYQPLKHSHWKPKRKQGCVNKCLKTHIQGASGFQEGCGSPIGPIASMRKPQLHHVISVMQTYPCLDTQPLPRFLEPQN